MDGELDVEVASLGARLEAMPVRIARRTYRAQDTILYALGVGAGMEPGELAYVYEGQGGPAVLATMATVLGDRGFWLSDPRYGLDWSRVLHGDQSLTLHRPLASHGVLRSEDAIEAVYDKGADRGAIACLSRRLYDEVTGELVASLGQSLFLRGDGGRGGRAGGPPRPAPSPDRPADLTIALGTWPEQALIYRLSGDENPLHADPVAARAAGFERPVLHGLCSYGVAGRAVLKAIRGRGGRELTRFDLRFSAPVYPGETLETEIWWGEAGKLDFRTRVVERDVVVLAHGVAEYR